MVMPRSVPIPGPLKFLRSIVSWSVTKSYQSLPDRLAHQLARRPRVPLGRPKRKSGAGRGGGGGSCSPAWAAPASTSTRITGSHTRMGYTSANGETRGRRVGGLSPRQTLRHYVRPVNAGVLLEVDTGLTRGLTPGLTPGQTCCPRMESAGLLLQCPCGRHWRSGGGLAFRRIHACRVGTPPRVNAAAADRATTAAARQPQRTDVDRRSGGRLSAVVAAPESVCRRNAEPASGHRDLHRIRRAACAVRHGHCRQRRRGQKHDLARAEGAVVALAEPSPGRSHHHPWIPHAVIHARGSRPHGAQGIPGKLRCTPAGSVSRRCNGTPV